MTEVVSSISELIAQGHITDVRFVRFSGEVREEPDESFEDDDVMQQMQLNLRKTDTVVEFELTADVQTKNCVYAATAATQVTVSDGVIDESLIREFASRIGLTVVYPYVREAIQSASSRLRRENIVIPLVDPDTVQLEPVEG